MAHCTFGGSPVPDLWVVGKLLRQQKVVFVKRREKPANLRWPTNQPAEISRLKINTLKRGGTSPAQTCEVYWHKFFKTSRIFEPHLAGWLKHPLAWVGHSVPFFANRYANWLFANQHVLVYKRVWLVYTVCKPDTQTADCVSGSADGLVTRNIWFETNKP